MDADATRGTNLFIFSKTIAIWLNSTLGRIALRLVTGRKISYPMLNPVPFNAVTFFDIQTMI